VLVGGWLGYEVAGFVFGDKLISIYIFMALLLLLAQYDLSF
jgi:hypothetical protein